VVLGACLVSGIMVDDQMMVESRSGLEHHGHDHDHVHDMSHHQSHDMNHHYNHPDSPMMTILTKSVVNHPYRYMKDPMAKVPLKNPMVIPYIQPGYTNKFVRLPSLQPKPYSHQMRPTYQDLAYMVGEQFFKEGLYNPENDHLEDIVNFLQEEGQEEEQIPYEVVQSFGSYEKRHYPTAVYACVQEKVDTATDPLAGLRFSNQRDVIKAMRTDRWQKLPSTRMFNELFKYINGHNEQSVKINMTGPVTTLHHVERRDYLGSFEIQEMCFYLPSVYQADHEHKEGGPSPRHISEEAPQPQHDSKVFLHTRPEMDVYVRTFGGFAITEEVWETERKKLEADLADVPHHDNEFFTACYNSPWEVRNRRNEVWIQCVEPGHPVIEAILADNHYDDEHEQGHDILDTKAHVKKINKKENKKEKPAEKVTE